MRRFFTRFSFVALVLLFNFLSLAQGGSISGTVTVGGKPAGFATVVIHKTQRAAVADSAGQFFFHNVASGNYTIMISLLGHQTYTQKVRVTDKDSLFLRVELHTQPKNNLDEIVVTGTLKEVRRTESPVPVEIYTPQYFRKNPTPNIFEALQNVNGVRPQINCNVCNTGDIHINGLEGPYTMVLIDGMPIVSSLSTVYGLSGISNSLVERIEIVKGPASSLYGSEAVGGLINIITKKPSGAPLFSADVFSTTWKELNADLGLKLKAGKKLTALTGINYFHYGHIMDKNRDNFTDVTLQHRISLFQKWAMERKQNRLFSVAFRNFYEDRWGSDTRWTKAFRGGDSIYGESIYTKRWELIGQYQLPVKEKLMFSFSYNDHKQDSRYGTTAYIAHQRISFSQFTWDKTAGKHDLLAGAALRYTFYDDNTPATASADSLRPGNRPDRIWLPGIFLQDEVKIAGQHKILLGLRYDHNSVHGNIFTPRFAYKWSMNDQNIIRLNAGTGFRVVNLFTEDHAALTGARKVEITEALKPERSWNINLNYLKKMYSKKGNFLGLDATAWYTHFNNRIVPDFETDVNKIVYGNLSGFAISKGISLNADAVFTNGFKIMAGTTFQDVSTTEAGIKKQQLLTEHISGTWAISYKIKKLNTVIDYTGNLYGPMRLPLLGDLDPRQPRSPTWSLQNIQLTFGAGKNVELYGGIKNLLNFTPSRGNPFIIARSHDPFDKEVQYNSNGQVVPTAGNPYALTFDPTYVYAPNQGRRGFLGLRITVR
jgi:outer membrane receptor for ferrienterochelin and colicins